MFWSLRFLLTGFACCLCALFFVVRLGAPSSAEDLFHHGRGLIETAQGERYLFSLEIADTPEARAQGLMFRESLDKTSAMLLVWPEPRAVGIWMKNTLIPLDLLYIRSDGVIVRIHQGAKPRDLTILHSGESVGSVLEVQAGLVAELGLATGDQFRLLD